MPSTPLEQYAFLSDGQTGALISQAGSLDWLCFPRFDSEALFTALLGTEEHGRWLMAPKDGTLLHRSYRDNTFIVDSQWVTPTGKATITEFMPVNTRQFKESDVVRSVTCTEGTVEIEHDLRLRFNYGASVPWVEKVKVRDEWALAAIAGPTSIHLFGPRLSPEGYSHGGTYTLREGESECWTMVWSPSYEPVPEVEDHTVLEAITAVYWNKWAEKIDVRGPYSAEIVRSLLVLRALTDNRTGGIVAAATISLPEEFGGSRNWDYRYTWLRDSALTIEALVAHGFTDGALAWRDWLLRAIAGDTHSLRIMYGLAGERHLPEFELHHLPGYESSTPVRIGNGAAGQFQGDVVGEVMLALDKLRRAGMKETERSWGLQKELLKFAEENFDRPEHGIWEMRGELTTFTHSRVMMWAAFDRGISAVRDFGYDGPIEHWEQLRDRLAQEIEEKGWNEEIQSYTQTYGAAEVDASLLQLPQVGYCAYDDPKMLSTVARIEKDLVDNAGFVHRYRTAGRVDGLEGDEYPFLICTFWLVEQYAMTGRIEEARKLMDALVGIASPLGLLAEEYSPVQSRLAGNFPQAFSHLGLIRAADSLGNKLN
ncbi:glycoside hydrolase family 15 protein [Flaviflexus massiliensis]|uniref:glycoside hydrolase family 15 protein n=1 Tax=Flaviflexus massiliensis TaxID=1522309 RepID=UPI0009EC4954|nr:glycoside hydrolase family 15 protein [Flaviflexus massiliensis]